MKVNESLDTNALFAIYGEDSSLYLVSVFTDKGHVEIPSFQEKFENLDHLSSFLNNLKDQHRKNYILLIDKNSYNKAISESYDKNQIINFLNQIGNKIKAQKEEKRSNFFDRLFMDAD